MNRYQYRKKQGDAALYAEICRLRAHIRSLQAQEIAPLPDGVHDALFAQMFERHAAIMLLIDPSTRTIVDANLAAMQFYGYPRDVLRGLPVDRINAQPEADVAPQRQEAIAGIRKRFVFDHRLASGAIRTVESHISTIDWKGRLLFFSILHDVTERKRADAQIRALAYHDALTQLPNRRLLFDRLADSMAVASRTGHFFAFMLLDLDRFKPLNDTYGHAAGDLLLVEVARRIRECVRDVDTLARLGGDEFVIILDPIEADRQAVFLQANRVAERIRASLNRPYRLAVPDRTTATADIEYHCPASIGIVVVTQHEVSADDIFKWADRAMYTAKSSGGNRICFHDGEAASGAGHPQQQ